MIVKSNIIFLLTNVFILTICTTTVITVNPSNQVLNSSNETTTASTLATAASSNNNSSSNKPLMHDSSKYMTLTTTPASAVVEVVTLNSTIAKNETLKAQEQNQFPAGPYGNFIPGQSPLPPQLIAALQRRQQLLQAQSK